MKYNWWNSEQDKLPCPHGDSHWGGYKLEIINSFCHHLQDPLLSSYSLLTTVPNAFHLCISIFMFNMFHPGHYYTHVIDKFVTDVPNKGPSAWCHFFHSEAEKSFVLRSENEEMLAHTIEHMLSGIGHQWGCFIGILFREAGWSLRACTVVLLLPVQGQSLWSACLWNEGVGRAILHQEFMSEVWGAHTVLWAQRENSVYFILLPRCYFYSPGIVKVFCCNNQNLEVK